MWPYQSTSTSRSVSMPTSNDEIIIPAQLRQLYKLLGKFRARIDKEQPLAGQVVTMGRRWVETEDDYDK